MIWQPWANGWALCYDGARLAMVRQHGRRWFWCLLGPDRARSGTTHRADLARAEAESAVYKLLETQAN